MLILQGQLVITSGRLTIIIATHNTRARPGDICNGIIMGCSLHSNGTNNLQGSFRGSAMATFQKTGANWGTCG